MHLNRLAFCAGSGSWGARLQSSGSCLFKEEQPHGLFVGWHLMPLYLCFRDDIFEIIRRAKALRYSVNSVYCTIQYSADRGTVQD